MDELLALWDLWAIGVVAPETKLWGIELFWWNRIATALQAVALVIVFFELIGSEGRQKAANFFDSKAYDTMVENVSYQVRKQAALIQVAIASFPLRFLWTSSMILLWPLGQLNLLGPTNKIAVTTRPLYLKLFRFWRYIGKKDREYSRKAAALGAGYFSIRGRTPKDHLVGFAVIAFYTLLLWLYSQGMLTQPGDHSVRMDVMMWGGTALIYIFCLTSGTLAHLWMFWIEAAIKITYQICKPLLKRFFDEKYERHWIAAALLSGLIGLHFSILIS